MAIVGRNSNQLWCETVSITYHVQQSNRRDDSLLGRRWSPLTVLQRAVIRSKLLAGGSPNSSGPPEGLSALHTCFILEEPSCMQLVVYIDPCLMWAGSPLA